MPDDDKEQNPFYDFLEMCVALFVVAIILAVILLALEGGLFA